MSASSGTTVINLDRTSTRSIPSRSDPVAKTARLSDIDRAKGLAIVLVVVGHIVARTPPAGNDWYVQLKDAIYLFHMPFFIFLSGLVMAYTHPTFDSLGEYGRTVRRRFTRLFPAYVLFALVILLGKLGGQGLVTVDNAPRDFWSGLADIVLRPTSSAASSLWFIYALFIFYVIFPPLIRAFAPRLWLLPIVALPLHFVRVTDLFLIDTILEYLFFFSLGAWIAMNFSRYTTLIDRHRVLFVGLFATVLFSAFVWPVVTGNPMTTFQAGLAKLVVGSASIPALHALVRSPILMRSSGLLLLGLYTFPIYLMNTIAIGVLKGALLKVAPWDGAYFLAYAPVLIVGGILLPIVAKRFFFSRVVVLDRITA